MDRKKGNMFYIPFIVAIVTCILSKRYKETFYSKVKTDLMNNQSFKCQGNNNSFKEHKPKQSLVILRNTCAPSINN